MELPLQVSFRHMEHSDVIEEMIRERAANLDKYATDIMSCRVVVEPASKHHKNGNPYDVRIDLTLKGEEIVVTREARQRAESKEIRVAIRDAFDAARRRIEDYVRRRRGEVKVRIEPPHARIRTLVPHADHGFLETADGREIYFHRNSVLNGGFDDLEVGMEVAFAEEMGENGPQASTVKPVGRHQHKYNPKPTE